ncbi:MAG: hypothetical protein M3164_03880 [Actinomycetota bacterium]|nr:hypothetical protein [Actinomycetota bacterium]
MAEEQEGAGQAAGAGEEPAAASAGEPDSVDAALSQIPGLAESVAAVRSGPAPGAGEQEGEEGEVPVPPRSGVEDTPSVQAALDQIPELRDRGQS